MPTATHRRSPEFFSPTLIQSTNYPSDTYEVLNENWSARKAKLVILNRLGRGAEGEVLDAKLIYTDDDGIECEYPCVAKHLFTESDPETPLEFKLQKELTSDHPSGLLRIIGIHTVIDEKGKTHKYAIQPKCVAILSSGLPLIRSLDEENQSKNLFQHVVMNFFRSMIHGLEILAEHKIAHRDLKPENIGIFNDEFWMLDFGLAQRYEDFINEKNNSARRSSIEGTPHFIPPERLDNHYELPFARDVWAFGQILLKLRGLKSDFQVNEYGTELSNHPHLFRKGNAYKIKRDEENNKRSIFDDANHQQQLQNEISQQTTFENCLTHITNSMREILPERRPNLITLKNACEKLASLLPALTFREEFRLKLFYEEKIRGVRAIPSSDEVQTTPATYSDARFFILPQTNRASDDVEFEMSDNLTR